jgi:hypothetical protein
MRDAKRLFAESDFKDRVVKARMARVFIYLSAGRGRSVVTIACSFFSLLIFG